MKALTEYQQKFDRLHDDCPVRAALDVIRGRWKPSILYELKTNPKRFTELQQAMRGITPQALTVQLRQLEADEIVARTVYPEMPVKVEYALTALGKTLSSVLDQLELWGAEYTARQTRSKARQA